MLKIKPLDTIMRIVPLFLLVLLSGYLTYTACQNYYKNTILKSALESSISLQSLEYSVLNELLCNSTLSHHSEKSSIICKKTKETTNKFLVKLQKQDKHFNELSHSIIFLRKKLTNKNLDDLVKVLKSSKEDQIISDVTRALVKLESLTETANEKEMIQLYERIVNMSYATEIEKILVTYYLSKKVPISPENFIYWDKIITASELKNLELERYSTYGKEKLQILMSDKSFKKVLDKIDDIRVKTLYGGASAKYNNSNIQWITLLRKKQKILQNMQLVLLQKIDKDIVHDIQNSMWIMILYAAMLVFGLLSLFYAYRALKEEVLDRMSLLAMSHYITTSKVYTEDEMIVMNKMLNDVTEKRDIHNYVQVSFDLLAEKRKQVYDEAASKGAFLSTLSHEIRTPLNGIIGFTKLLKDMGMNQDQEEFLTLIETSSSNLISIVNDILELSKINADKMHIESVPFDIFDAVESTVSSFAQSTDQKDIELGIFIDPFLPQHFLGDATKLTQILTNLIGNAIKFTEPYGKIDIFVQGIKHVENRIDVKFAVNDTGIGLTKEEQKNIFNAYGQATKHTSSTYGGTGLGLTISSRMVELMGGTLEVESEKNKGANFFFTIHLEKDKNKEENKYPDFKDVSVGFALPVRSIKRQVDTNLEIYMKHLGADFSLYYYEELFEINGNNNLPDIMIFDHHYARLSGELEQCSSLPCKSVLITTANLRSRINPERHKFIDIVLSPISLKKSIRILRHARSVEKEAIRTSATLESIDSFMTLRVLVADDNMINRKLIKIILEKLGLEVVIVENGEDAVKMYKDNIFDIIFMDIQMPIMDGIEATRKILEFETHENLKHIPIIALTANTSVGDKEKYLSAGMDDYATKPLDVDVIKNIITKYCIDYESSKNKDK